MPSMNYIDVANKNDLPAAPPGFRYLDFLGGTSRLRCYLVPEATPRNLFLDTATDFDECHTPVYDHAGVVVRQDSSYALPGFYIVSFRHQYRAIDAIDLSMSLRAGLVIQDVRRAMRQELAIKYVHLHCEEKADESCNVHYWIMPVASEPGDKSTALTRLDIKKYLQTFDFQMTRDTIIDFNVRMRRRLQVLNTATRSDLIATCMESADPLNEQQRTEHER